MQPDLSLGYSSQAQGRANIVGYGWDVNIPYIERVNNRGTDKMYTDHLGGTNVVTDQGNRTAP